VIDRRKVIIEYHVIFREIRFGFKRSAPEQMMRGQRRKRRLFSRVRDSLLQIQLRSIVEKEERDEKGFEWKNCIVLLVATL